MDKTDTRPVMPRVLRPLPALALLPVSIFFTSLVISKFGKTGYQYTRKRGKNSCTAQSNAGKNASIRVLHRLSFSIAGHEIALNNTLCFDVTCSNQLMMSPSLCGSNPYPRGSLTYRFSFYNTFSITPHKNLSTRGGQIGKNFLKIKCAHIDFVNPICEIDYRKIRSRQ